MIKFDDYSFIHNAMKLFATFLMLLLPIISGIAQTPFGDEPLAHTYSIVAFDPETGEMGVAVQSHWFSVGTIVSWAEAGVGAIATQSFVNPAFGPDGLALLKSGLSAQETLDSLIAGDEGRSVRQLAIVDANGNTAVWTGNNCIEAAGNQQGKHFSVQANMMLNDYVWGAMAKAFEEAEGSLAERMVAALEAGESVGGDIRGKQSAALLVVGDSATGKPWVDRKVDIQIADHATPIKELKRLLTIHTAYEYMNQGDIEMEEGDFDAALESYSTAESLYADNIEMTFWKAVTMANSGLFDESLPLFKKTFAVDEKWKILVPRLIPNGLLTVSKEQLDLILE